MRTYYEVRISTTMRKAGRDQEWYNAGGFTKIFDTLLEAKKYIADQWFYCKTKTPMYNETKERDKKIGVVYKYKERDNNQDKTYYRNDWVSIIQITANYV